MSDETPQLPGEEVVTPPAAKVGGNVLSLLREILETLVFAVLVFLVLQTIWRNFWVEGQSMEPNIHDGQYLVVDHLVYNTGFPVNLLRATIGRSTSGSKLLDRFYHPPQRGDVIVFVPPITPSRDFIKRVIGIPGDRVEMKQGRVYVNGQVLAEPYIRPGPLTAWGPAVVGKSELFVMGDNRGNSSDSRSFGMLPLKNVIGKAWLSYWPPRRLGFIKHYDLAAQLQGSR